MDVDDDWIGGMVVDANTIVEITVMAYILKLGTATNRISPSNFSA